MTRTAFDAWKLLQGVVCTYKPSGCSSRYVVEKLIHNICRDLNNLETLPPRPYLVVDRSGPEVALSVRPRFEDHPLCSGPKYNKNNVIADIPSPLGNLTSGVLLVCVNGGKAILPVIQRLNFTKCYHIKGILGQATTNFHISEKVIARAKLKNVTQYHFERTLASYQSALQRRLFDEYGIHLQSQEAYNFAKRGLFRPGMKGAPITYSLKTVEFDPPNFTLEVQCIHDTETYLLNLIHNLGVSLKCYATCSEIRCIREGCFNIDHALVKRQWTLDELLNNVQLCWNTLEQNYPDKVSHSRTVTTVKAENMKTLDSQCTEGE